MAEQTFNKEELIEELAKKHPEINDSDKTKLDFIITDDKDWKNFMSNYYGFCWDSATRKSLKYKFTDVSVAIRNFALDKFDKNFQDEDWKMEFIRMYDNGNKKLAMDRAFFYKHSDEEFKRKIGVYKEIGINSGEKVFDFLKEVSQKVIEEDRNDKTGGTDIFDKLDELKEDHPELNYLSGMRFVCFGGEKLAYNYFLSEIYRNESVPKNINNAIQKMRLKLIANRDYSLKKFKKRIKKDKHYALDTLFVECYKKKVVDAIEEIMKINKLKWDDIYNLQQENPEQTVMILLVEKFPKSLKSENVKRVYEETLAQMTVA